MSNQPNIILVTIDSLRADHAYGDVVQTPTLDTLAEDGVKFNTAVAQGPFTTFSMPSLFTSRYPSQLTRFELPRWGTGAMVGEAPTLPERLSEEGYRTMGIHSNPLLSRTFGFNKGFDKFYDSLGRERALNSERGRVLVDKLKRLLRAEPYTPADVLTNKAIKWLSGVEENPFFLWIHFMDVHGPYKERDRPPVIRNFLSEWRWQRAVRSPESVSDSNRNRLKTAYEDEVAFTDRQMGRLVDALKEEKIYEDSIFVYTADHGEEFQEHGGYSHGNKLYNELLQVPLVVSPVDEPATEAVDSLIPLLDVTPTLLNAAGADHKDFEGRPLQDAYLNPSQERNRQIVSEADLEPTYTASVRTEGWKYIHNKNTEELYNIGTDPHANDDTLSEHPERASTLRDFLAKHADRTDATDEDISIEEGDLKERLRQLGYI